MDPEVNKKRKKRSSSSKKKVEEVGKKAKRKSVSKALGLCPGSDEHKAAAWKEYQESGGEWNKQRWENVYYSNMEKAKKANAAVKAYQETLGWGKTEVTVQIDDETVRRLDIADVDSDPKRGIEHKTGYICASEAIVWELERDAELVKKGWEITWYFEGEASMPLVGMLFEAGINVEWK